MCPYGYIRRRNRIVCDDNDQFRIIALAIAIFCFCPSRMRDYMAWGKNSDMPDRI